MLVLGGLVALLAGSSDAFLFGRNARASTNTTSVPYKDAFDAVESANLSHSYNVIAQVHLQNFEFKYDSIPGRRQLGLLASPSLKDLLQDGIHVYAERHVFTQDKHKVTIQNFHAVDKDALFMHNVGATQVLIRRAAEVQMALRSLASEVATAQSQLTLLQGHLETEASAVLVEQRKIAEAGVKHVELEIEKAKVQGIEDRLSLDVKKENELAVADKQHALHTERIQYEDIQRRAQNKELVDLQEAANQRMEVQRRDTETILKEKQLAADKERMWVEQNTTLEKAVIDVEGRIKQQRLNHDIEMQQLQTTLAAEQEKILRALQSAFDNIGSGIMTLLADSDKLMHFVGTVVAIACGIYVTRETIRIVGRLDLVIEQAFDIVNSFLNEDPNTRRRHLQIKTYKVTPLDTVAGVLEWVDNTMPMGGYLNGKPVDAHMRYHPHEWKHVQCRSYLQKATDKYAAYLDIQQHFTPVFHHYFLEKYPDPATWLKGNALATIVEVFIHDPLYNWTLSPGRALQVQKDKADNDVQMLVDAAADDDDENVADLAARVLLRVKQKLQGYEDPTGEAMSVEGQVKHLIQVARDPHNLCKIYPGWGPWL
ncbi:hypothetical protein DYB25_002217 [Aphanomyces astaci]|uniref:Uncharacterized protein n=1 Tax=Aphanomyces astaci TaxID=112090 RepID=A0A397B8F7_APHAT|nr:hypothetical protein DYB25_002217 [Aphanomyces astaci]